MKWILCGKNDAAVECLDFLIDQADEVLVVATKGDRGEDDWQRSLLGAARARGVPLEQPARINSDSFIARLADFQADALLSIQYDQILKNPLFESVGCPCLNLHFALLPRHRGVAPMAWVLLSGDSEAGVTLHFMVEDIDAGDIVARKSIPVAADCTARQLYDQMSRTAMDLFIECYPFAPEVLARRLPQDPASASYHHDGDFDFSQQQIDWNQPAATLHRWLRAMIFPPLQLPKTTLNGRQVEVSRIAAGLGQKVAAPPGVVEVCSDDRVAVATADRKIWLCDVTYAGMRATAPRPSIRVGDRLG
jgi:methionyl-tRNA formyltransferase